MISEKLKLFAFKISKMDYLHFPLLENRLTWFQLQNTLIKFNSLTIKITDEISFIFQTVRESFKGNAI